MWPFESEAVKLMRIETGVAAGAVTLKPGAGEVIATTGGGGRSSLARWAVALVTGPGA